MLRVFWGKLTRNRLIFILAIAAVVLLTGLIFRPDVLDNPYFVRRAIMLGLVGSALYAMWKRRK